MAVKLYMVLPCYNEEEVLRRSADIISAKMKSLIEKSKITADSRVLFVNDGSSDKTWDIIKKLNFESELFTGVSLSHNSGQQNALLAGLEAAATKCDAVVTMDVDLQDDINALDKMLDLYVSGCDIVFGARSDRTADTFFKRFTAQGYYRLLRIMGCDIVDNHADFRLMSSRAVKALMEYRESNMLIRGIVPKLGYNTAIVYYERKERLAGESKYPLKKMLALAFDGIFSLSMKPIRFITASGVCMLLLALAVLVFGLIRLGMGYSFLNWKIILVALFFTSGLILTALGIIGEYVGRAFFESKKRPRYNIGDTVGFDEQIM